MKRTTRLLLSILAIALIATSCSFTASLPDRFEKFVDKVDAGASSYTEQDWNRVSQQFDKLMNQYEDSYDKLSKEDRKRINASIGRYRAIILKSGFGSVIDNLDDTLQNLSSFINELSFSVGSFLENLGVQSTQEN